MTGRARSNVDPASLEKLLPHDEEPHPQPVNRRAASLTAYGRFIVECFLVLTALYLWSARTDQCFASQINFSPATEAIHYEPRKFTAGYLPGEKSKFQLDCPDCKPTDAIDEAWKGLYDGLMWSRIPRKQAAQLRNYTINIPGQEDHYLIGLDVFHQLHCLDNVRRGLWPERYSPNDYMGGQGMSLLSPKHLDHCIDQIRQSIMCQSDLSPNWLFWDPQFEANMAARDIEHSCRSFDHVVHWAEEHRQEPFDLSIKLYDPLKGE